MLSTRCSSLCRHPWDSLNHRFTSQPTPADYEAVPYEISKNTIAVDVNICMVLTSCISSMASCLSCCRIKQNIVNAQWEDVVMPAGQVSSPADRWGYLMYCCDGILYRSFTGEQPHRRRRFLTCCVRLSPEKEPERFVELVEQLAKTGTLQRLSIVPLLCGSAKGAPIALMSQLGSLSFSAVVFFSIYKLNQRRRHQRLGGSIGLSGKHLRRWAAEGSGLGCHDIGIKQFQNLASSCCLKHAL